MRQGYVTWEDVVEGFCGDGTEVHFAPHGPEVPTVAVISRDLGGGVVVELQMPTRGDGRRDPIAFLDFVFDETSTATDRRLAETVGVDPDDPEAVDVCRDEIEGVQRTYWRWAQRAVGIAVEAARAH